MVTSLLKHGRINTTVTRAKELRILAEKMITLGKDGSLHARRQALSVIREKPVVARLFNEIAPAFEDRNGGYTRIVRTAPRRGDGSMMCIIELVSTPVTNKASSDTDVRQDEQQDVASAIPEAVPETGVEDSAQEDGVAADSVDDSATGDGSEDMVEDDDNASSPESELDNSEENEIKDRETP
jgi:large subunit ribosomal protein L17